MVRTSPPRNDEDKKAESLNQSPPRTPRVDELESFYRKCRRGLPIGNKQANKQMGTQIVHSSRRFPRSELGRTKTGSGYYSSSPTRSSKELAEIG